MSHRIVFLAYYFPPLVGIASERASSLSRHLGALGWEPTTITVRSGFYHRSRTWEGVDDHVIRTRSIELSRIIRGFYSLEGSRGDEIGTVRAVKTGRFGDSGRRFLRDFVYVPDAQIGWIPFAMTAAIRTVAAGSAPAVIYSTSVPYSAHLAAIGAARRTGAPWVAELRDPWSTGSSVQRFKREMRHKTDAALERWIVHAADHVIVTTEFLRRELLGVYSDLAPEKVNVVTNGFEPIPEGAVPPGSAPMTILYAGTVSAGEDMTPLLAMLDRLHQLWPDAFRMHVLGPPDPWRQSGSAAGSRSWLQLDGVATPARAREAMAESSVLLHVQCHPAYENILPGKLFEYIGARRPIVAVCPPESEMGALLTQYADVRFVRPNAMEALNDVLEQLLHEHASGRIQTPRVSASLTAPLRRGEQAGQLARILEGVVERRPAL